MGTFSDIGFANTLIIFADLVEIAVKNKYVFAPNSKVSIEIKYSSPFCCPQNLAEMKYSNNWSSVDII